MKSGAAEGHLVPISWGSALFHLFGEALQTVTFVDFDRPWAFHSGSPYTTYRGWIERWIENDARDEPTFCNGCKERTYRQTR